MSIYRVNRQVLYNHRFQLALCKKNRLTSSKPALNLNFQYIIILYQYSSGRYFYPNLPWLPCSSSWNMLCITSYRNENHSSPRRIQVSLYVKTPAFSNRHTSRRRHRRTANTARCSHFPHRLYARDILWSWCRSNLSRYPAYSPVSQSFAWF